MEPLNDANVELVGWIERDHYIWDTNMDWIVYVFGGHAWSSESDTWCGPVHETTCLDQSGHVVAWSPANAPAGTARPARPARPGRAARSGRPGRPGRPARPARPPMPVGGWSQLSFQAWAAGE
jgi:hypothetical protein